MSALAELYRDDSDTDEDASSFADADDRREEEGAEASESTDAEETIEDTIEDEEATYEREEGEEEDDSDRRGSDAEESERSDKSNSDRGGDDEASDQDRDRSSSSNRESDRESDGENGEKDESESENYNEEKREGSESEQNSQESDSGYGKDESDEDDSDYKDRGFEVYGNEDPDDFKDEPDPEKALDAPRGASSGMSTSQKTAFVCCCLICMLLALVGGAVLGAILTDQDENLRSVFGLDSEDDGDADLCPGGTLEPTIPPIPQGPPTAVFKCPEDNAALEFRIIFDANPGDVGLSVTDPFGISMWNFPTKSFGSFALLLRENIFTLCLSPQQNYTFELTDSGENGFISTFGAEIYGSFSLLYADELVTTYYGDCNATNSQECGNFCKCTYLLAVNASSGACTTTCEAEV